MAFAGSDVPADHKRIEPAPLGPRLVFFGPELPIAFCRSCDTRLSFERITFDRWPRPSPTGWRCHCEGCVDGEYVGDPLTLQMSVKAGEGESPWLALDDLAAMHFDCEPEELLEPKERT